MGAAEEVDELISKLADDSPSKAPACSLARLRTTLRVLILAPVLAVIIPFGIIAATVVGLPLMLAMFLCLAPAASIRWAWVGDETWWEAFKYVRDN